MPEQQKEDLFIENIKQLQEAGFKFTYSGHPEGQKRANAVLDLMQEGYRIREIEVNVRTTGNGYLGGDIDCRYKSFFNIIHELGKNKKIGRWLRDHIPEKLVTLTHEKKFYNANFKSFAYNTYWANLIPGPQF